jgi:hypothetical protein
MARPDGFEPPTTWFEAKYSIQLSYGREGAILAWLPADRYRCLSRAHAGQRTVAVDKIGNTAPKRSATGGQMKKFLPLFAILPLCLATAYADCSYPRAPDKIPNGSTASLDEMKTAKSQVEKYNKDMEAYLSCIKLEHDDAVTKGTALSEEQKKQMATMHAQKNDAAVDELQSVASRFNEQVRAYKAKPPAAK